MITLLSSVPPSAKLKLVKALYHPEGKPPRPMSNLLIPSDYPLGAKDNQGIIALFKMKASSWRNTQMWCSVFAEIVFPTLKQSSNLQKVAKDYRKQISEVSKQYTALQAPVLVKVKKTDAGAEVSIPVFAISSQATNVALAVCCAPDLYTEYAEKFPALLQTIVTDQSYGTAVPAYESLRAGDKAIMRALNGTFRLAADGSKVVMYLDLILTRTQLSNICNNEFDNVRPIDLYGLVRTWAQARTDVSLDLPRNTKPLADIVATLPPGGEPRLSEDGILVDPSGDYYSLPKAVNNVSRYDASLALALTNQDGYVSQVHAGGVQKMPFQQLVLLDWVNMKWSYVNTSGNLEVRDLSRTQPCNVTHVRNFLALEVAGSTNAVSFLSKASVLSDRVGMPHIDVQVFITSAVDLLQANPDYAGTVIRDIRLYYFQVLADMANNPLYLNIKGALQVYSDFAETVKRLAAIIDKDPEVFYKDFSVLTTSEFQAQATMFSKYAKDFDNIDGADKQRRAKYTAPMVDPTYQLPDIPFVASDRGLLPHQAKATNMLRESPDNAILGVDAGGGKTPLGVVDILKEMKQGIKGPFLVLCPAHLVAQYVIEFSYFTESRINTVAVTSFTLRRHGMEGLARMIEVAPINTVVIADYNLAKGGKTVEVGYGTSATQVYRVVEFLRQFRFNYVICDESHMLKNVTSTQSKAVATLIADIPKKRLASGTFISNGAVDIAGQFSLLDPTVFGTPDNFSRTYSADGSPGKIAKMRPGAELEIMQKMRSSCRYIQIKRKEWAAILPKRIESFDHLVKLSDAQRVVYNTILDKSIEALTLAAATNKKLATLLGVLSMSDEDRERAMDDMDEDAHESAMIGGIDELLRPYLARLEKFLCAPGKDPLGDTLQGDDRISPKIAELAKIIREHIAGNIPGKILAFTNQTDSAEDIFNNLPADLKAISIHYTSGQKEACGSEFENNPNLKFMVGVGSSMETGLNLQFCSRLIRLETVMSPGALEQGNARIGRPNIKAVETRNATYYDWILVDQSIDLTKVAYLLTKKVRISAIEEAGNPLYAKIEIPELFSLNLDNIRAANTIDTLEEYLGPEGMYRKFKMAEAADYEKFKNDNKQFLDENGKLKMTPLKRSEDLEGAKIMRRIPYVPGLKIYGTEQLGLVRLDQHLRMEVNAGDEEDSDNDAPVTVDGPDDLDQKAKDIRARDEFISKIKGLWVHTAYGEGEVTGGSLKQNRVMIKLASGETKHAAILNTFVITKPQTSGKDIRGMLAKMAGSLPIDTPYDAPEVERILPSSADLSKAKKAVNKTMEMALSLVVTNDMIGLELDSPQENKDAAKTLRAIGFKDTVPYFYAKLATPQIMLKFFQTLAKEGYQLPKTMSTNLQTFYRQWSTMRKNAFSLFGQATAAEIKNFYLLNHQPANDPKQISAYITVEDETVFLCLPSQAHKGNTNIVSKVHVPNVRFYRATPQLVKYFKTPAEALTFIRGFLKSGVVLANEQELHDQFRKLHKLVPKATGQSVEEFFNSK